MHLDNMEQIQKRVLEDMDLSEENDDARLKKKIEEKVWEYGKEHLISLEEEQRYVQEIFCSLRRFFMKKQGVYMPGKKSLQEEKN